MTRVDLHCHSSASAVAGLAVQGTLGLPECATPPEEVHALAKRRGMDFVTITDHDTIDGVLAIADRPDVFVSEELTAAFRGEPQRVHVLCLGITPEDHDRLQAHAGDVEVVAAYLHERGIACALAHPFYNVAAPLTPRHRRRLAELFGTWEVRNGARDAELNLPAAIYVETHGGTGVGGTDDHAGIDIGRTFTETPAAATPAEFLAHVRAGRAEARGDQGSAARWAHNAMALAVRALGSGGPGAAPDPEAVLRMVERVLGDAEARGGARDGDLGPDDARALLRAWLAAVGLDRPDAELLAYLQADGFSHADLYRRARRAHEKRLAAAVGRAAAAASALAAPTLDATGIEDGIETAALGLFDACVPAIPYAAAAAFLGREKRRLARGGGPLRVALLADGVGAVHGVTRVIDEIRERGVPGFHVDVIGTDPHVDRRLPLHVGVPGVPDLVEALAEGRYDLVHVSAPGPVGAGGAATARMLGLPVAGSHHTEFAAYAQLRTGDPRIVLGMQLALGALYQQCAVVLSPSAAADATLAGLGVDAARIARWDRGVDTERFTPARRRRRAPRAWRRRRPRARGRPRTAGRARRARAA